ncbi:NFATC2-interacting protein [Pholidichthys leucotaenia]
MADGVSNDEVQVVNPPPKRSRILDRSTIVPIPVYSSKVKNCLHLKLPGPLFFEKSYSDVSTEFPQIKSPPVICVSDSEDDTELEHNTPEHALEAVCSLSPSPPKSPVEKQSRKVQKKIKELDRRLQAINSVFSPELEKTRPRRKRCKPIPVLQIEQDDDDDVVILSPASESQSSQYSTSAREIPLKIRYYTDIHRIPVCPSTPLSSAVTQLSIILDVPPARLLLLKDEVELPTSSTVGELGLGIADILECVIKAAENESQADSDGIITVKLQSKDKDSSWEFSILRNSPLGPIFSQYLSNMSSYAQKKVHFQFDGSKVTARQTPAQLDMEDGDIIEVWT